MKLKAPVGSRRGRWLLAAGLILGAVLTTAALPGLQDDSLGSINGSPVDRREFALLVSQERVKAAQYFKQRYNAAVNESFWTTSYEGVTPADYTRQAALDRLVEYRLEQRLALQYGLETPGSYEQFLDRLRTENERRKAALQNGQPIYGPVQYSEWTYYDYLHSNLLIQLKDKLKETELTVSEDETHQAYEQRKDTRYRIPDEVAVNVISFLPKDGSRATEALSMLTGGVAFRDVQRALSSYALKRKADGEGIRLGGVRTEDAAEAEERLLGAALKLKNGEAVRVDFASYSSVLQLTGKTEQGYLSYDDVKASLRSELADQLFERYIGQLKRQAKIEINQRNFRRVNIGE